MKWMAALAVIHLLPQVLSAQIGIGGELAVPRTDTPPVIDGLVDDAAWRSAAVLDDWVQVKPGDNIAPAGRTVAWLLYDRNYLYVGVRAWDDRSKMRYRLHERDKIMDQGQDFVGLELDTFNDRRRAFGMVANALGVQGDGINVEGSGFTEWDGDFDTRGRVLDDGWSVEFRIPFSSLRYPSGAEQRWGFAMRRGYGREGMEDSPWPKDRNLACTLCQMITLTGIRDIPSSRALEVNPTLVARTSESRPDLGEPFAPRESKLDPGLNLKYGLGPGVTVDVTANPDFSQIEADAGQLELNNRFALFFPERRPFFLEGADLFQTRFPLPGADAEFSPPPINLVYTRRIVDPIGGAKLSGKVERAGLGAIAAMDDYRGYVVEDSVGGLPPEQLDLYSGSRVFDGIARGRVDVLSDGFVGATGTVRTLGDGWNVVGALDTRLRFGSNTTFRLIAGTSGTQEQDLAGHARRELDRALRDPALVEAAYDSLPDDVKDLDGERYDGQALQAQLEYQSRHWSFGGGYLDVTEGFDTQLGFTPRTDQVLFSGFVKYKYQGTGFFKQVEPGFRLEQGYDHDQDRLFSAGQRTDFLARTDMDMILPGNTMLFFGYARNFIRFDDIDFDDLDRGYLWISSQPLSQVSAQLFVRAGEEVIYYDVVEEGDPLPNFFVSGTATLGLRPVPSVRLDLSANLARIWRRTGTATRESLYGESVIPRTTLRIQFVRELGLRAIGEYRIERFYARDGTLARKREGLFADLLLSYVVHPNQSIQAGWSQSGEGDLEVDRQWTSRGGLVKFSYVWRF